MLSLLFLAMASLIRREAALGFDFYGWSSGHRQYLNVGSDEVHRLLVGHHIEDSVTGDEDELVVVRNLQL